MARWFGPAGPCGCCSAFTPCECQSDGTTGSCVPAFPGYYEGLAIEISEVPNEIYRTDTGIDYACDSRTCRPTEDLTRLTDWRYAGFEAINGTYPITFLQYNADTDEYFESDPRNGCGFWATSNIEIEVVFTELRFSEFNFSGSTPPCNAVDIVGTATLTLIWNPFTNSFAKPSYPVVLTNYLFPNRSEPLIPFYADGTLVRTGETTQAGCNGGGITTTLANINSNDPLISKTTTPALVGGLVADPFGSVRVTAPGLASGIPKAPPAGMTIVNSQFCNILRVESFIEYEEKTFVTNNTPGNCGIYRDITFGPWQVRRKLVYTGVS